MIEDLKYYLEKYGSFSLFMLDNILDITSREVKEFLKFVIEKKDKISLAPAPRNFSTSFFVHFLRIDEEGILLLKQLGVTEMMFRTDASCERVYKEIVNKDGSFEILKESIDLCKKYGIKVGINALTGFPGEREEEIKNMRKYYKNNFNADEIYSQPVLPLYGTKLWDLARSNPEHAEAAKMKNAKKIFCVPYNGDYYGVKDMVNDHEAHIYEFYGTDSQFSSAKWSFDHQKSKDSRIYTFKKTIEFLNSKNIKFNYLLNSPTENYMDKIGDIKKLLKELKNMGVESITLSYPYLISYAKEKGFKIVHSILQNTCSDLRIKHLLEYGGGDRFIVHGNYIRQINALKYLKKILPENSFLEIPVNLNCRLDCPNEIMHYNCGDSIFFKDFFRKDKRGFKDWLQRVWVRHKDIEEYQSIGIDFFKITERAMPSKTIYNYLKYFIDGSMMNPSQILYPGYFKDELTGTVVTDDELDNYFDFIFSEPGCTGKCTECGNYCDMYVDRLEKKYSLKGAFIKPIENFV
jgi:hypothetical protein